DGSRRFLDRIWRLLITEDGLITDKVVNTNNKALDKSYHQTVKKVSEDFETLNFNTAISQLMVFINDCYKVDEIYKPYIEVFRSDGSRRFLDRIWRLLITEDGLITDKVVNTNNKALDKSYHQTVKKVSEDFETLNFNTAISQLMVFINDCYKVDEIYKPYIEGFIKMLAPIA